MQWVVLLDSPGSSGARRGASPPSPTMMPIGLTDALPNLPLGNLSAEASGAGAQQSDGQSGLGSKYGRYLGQIHARIDRAWQRPRTAIGAPIFQCQVQVDQDGTGRVREITLLECNGGTRWQLSLVHAIEAASPLPAPADPEVFVRHVLLEFRAVAYSPGESAQLYEPPSVALANDQRRGGDSQSQDVFQALREAARAPNSHRVVGLRIQGSKVEVEPDSQ